MGRMKIGCLGLWETRWTGKGHFVSDAGSTVIYSSKNSRKEVSKCGGDSRQTATKIILVLQPSK